MKTIKISVMLAAAAIAGAALAAQNDALVSFSTKGPDKYADGATVIDGECYALVWTAPGSAGLTVAADGTATGGEIVLVAPVAKGGKCPKVVFEVDAGDMAKKYRGGSWSVLLLDTRRWGADGVARPAGLVSGRLGIVNATGAVSGGSVGVAAASSSSVSAISAAVASASTAVPEGAPRPTITGIRVEGANVFVTVKGTVPYLQYGLTAGDEPGAVTDSVSEVPQTGAAAPDEEIVLVAPAKAGGAFFKVGRK